MEALAPSSCLLCGQVASGGLVIRGVAICQGCEARLLTLPVGEPDYEECRKKLKILWTEGCS